MGVDAVGVLRVEVTDNGAVIAPEDQKKVFGEFTQFNKNELQGGGRLICQGIIVVIGSNPPLAAYQAALAWVCGFLEGLCTCTK